MRDSANIEVGDAVRKPPRTFKVVRLAGGEELAEGTDARATIDVLEQVDSIFDVRVYVWHPVAKAWRRLSIGELRILWSFRGR